MDRTQSPAVSASITHSLTQKRSKAGHLNQNHQGIICQMTKMLRLFLSPLLFGRQTIRTEEEEKVKLVYLLNLSNSALHLFWPTEQHVSRHLPGMLQDREVIVLVAMRAHFIYSSFHFIPNSGLYVAIQKPVANSCCSIIQMRCIMLLDRCT